MLPHPTFEPFGCGSGAGGGQQAVKGAMQGSTQGRPADVRFDAFRLAGSAWEVSGRLDPASLERLADRVCVPGASVAWTIRGTTDEQGRPAIRVFSGPPVAFHAASTLSMRSSSACASSRAVDALTLDTCLFAFQNSSWRLGTASRCSGLK